MNPLPRSSHMHTRRDWIIKGARWGGLLVLGGIAVRLGWRGRGACELLHPCGACPQFAGCGLPKARQAQQPPTPRPTGAGPARPPAS